MPASLVRPAPIELHRHRARFGLRFDFGLPLVALVFDGVGVDGNRNVHIEQHGLDDRAERRAGLPAARLEPRPRSALGQSS